MKKEKKKMTAKQKKEWFEAVRNNDIETVKKMLKEGIDVNFQSQYGETALHWSCFYDRIEGVKLLLKHGADVNMQDEYLKTPLHFACYWGKIDIAKLLIENRADINIRDMKAESSLDKLKLKHPKRYEKLIQWLSEEYSDKMLGYMASESVQSKSVGL